MSLRAILRAAAMVLALLMVASVLTRVALASRLHQAREELSCTIESVRIVERLEVELLDDDTQRNLLLARDGAPPSDQLARELEDVQEVRRYAHSPADEKAVEGVQANIYQYATSRQRVDETRPSLAEAMAQTSIPLDNTFMALGTLVETKLSETRAAEDSAEKYAHLVHLLEWSFAAVLAVAIGGAFFGMRRYVVRPLLAAQDAMARMGAGDKRARAMEAGPAELRQTVHSFNEMAGALERQHENELTFLAGVAHDLRNPLSALSTAVASFQPDAPLPPEMWTRRLLAIIVRQIQRLSRLVGDLLDATRIEAGQLELRTEVRDLRQIAREVAELYQSTSAIHDFAIAVPAREVVVRCDPVRMEQVVGNLLSNAIKYSPQGGRVGLSVEVSPETSEALLTVTDQGIGISPEDQKHLFEPFRRTGALGQTTPGSGLGLSVASRIVAAHGGRISVQSAAAEGSSFRVVLPLAERRG